MEEAGREGEGMVFLKTVMKPRWPCVAGVHLHTRVGIATDSLNKPWTEDQKHKILMTTVGKILFNDIMPERAAYLQEPTNANLTEGVPAKYFLEPGKDIKSAINPRVEYSVQEGKSRGNIIAETFQSFRTTEHLPCPLEHLGYHDSYAGWFDSSCLFQSWKTRQRLLKNLTV